MKPSVAILMHSITCGGAERVTALLSNGLARRGYDMSLITLGGPQNPFYELRADVRRRPLDLQWDSTGVVDMWHKNMARVRAIRRTLRDLRPDVLISLMAEPNVLAILSTRLAERVPVRTILGARNHPTRMALSPITRLARRVCYPLADRLVTCSRGIAEMYRGWMSVGRVIPIQNPVLLEDRPGDSEAEALAAEIQPRRCMIAMGRLVRQKGYDMLFEALSRIPEETRRDWTTIVLGEGRLREELDGLARRLGIDDMVRMPGQFRNPYPVLRAADLYVMSSRYEGFPNALTEAMACGLPAVSFNCPTGPGEIIRDGTDGLLVPPGDVGALAEALTDLMSDADRRKRMAERAPEVLERFSLERFLDQWERLIRRV
ncbi:MAG: glycosyltransferase family 4 protein [Candidatus Brocadiia bacterium]